jgi:hypothetical protein
VVTHDHCIAQSGREVPHNGPVIHLTEGTKHKTRTILYHLTLMREAYRLLGQKGDLATPGPIGGNKRDGAMRCNKDRNLLKT